MARLCLQTALCKPPRQKTSRRGAEANSGVTIGRRGTGGTAWTSGISSTPVRFLLKVCAFFFVAGLLSLALGTLNEIFGLGIWHSGGYPGIFTFNEKAGQGVQQEPVGYGQFMLEFGAVTLGALLLGVFFQWRLRIREMRAFAAWVGDMDDEERSEFMALLDEDIEERD